MDALSKRVGLDLMKRILAENIRVQCGGVTMELFRAKYIHSLRLSYLVKRVGVVYRRQLQNILDYEIKHVIHVGNHFTR